MKYLFGFLWVFIFSFASMADEPAERPSDATRPPQMEAPELELEQPAPVEAEPFKVEENPGQHPAEYDPDNHEYKPIVLITPQYPKKAIRKCQEGTVLLQFTVTEEGQVKDIEVLEENPVDFGFADASVKAAEKYKYDPRVIDGLAMEVKEVRHKTMYHLADPC